MKSVNLKPLDDIDEEEVINKIDIGITDFSGDLSQAFDIDSTTEKDKKKRADKDKANVNTGFGLATANGNSDNKKQTSENKPEVVQKNSSGQGKTQAKPQTVPKTSAQKKPDKPVTKKDQSMTLSKNERPKPPSNSEQSTNPIKMGLNSKEAESDPKTPQRKSSEESLPCPSKYDKSYRIMVSPPKKAKHIRQAKEKKDFRSPYRSGEKDNKTQVILEQYQKTVEKKGGTRSNSKKNLKKNYSKDQLHEKSESMIQMHNLQKEYESHAPGTPFLLYKK